MKLRFPHPLVLLAACIALAAALTYVLPAGKYERREDAATGRQAVVPDTYARVEQTPVAPWSAVAAVQKGLVSAGSVIAFVLLVGGAFGVVEQTGALAVLVEEVARKLERRAALVIPLVCLLFAAGGYTFGMEEEIPAFVPVLLLLVARLGYEPLVAVAISLVPARIGGAMSGINPFGVGIAQTIAEQPLRAGIGFRTVACLAVLAVYTLVLMRYAARTRRDSTTTGDAVADAAATATTAVTPAPSASRSLAVLVTIALAFVVLVYGVLQLDWSIDELAGLFLAMGVLAGLCGGLGVTGTAEAFARGFAGVAYGAVLIGFARAILVVLEQGQVIDTIVHGLFAPVSALPVSLAAAGMLAVQSLIRILVPSSSGQAMITLPILVPLSDLLGLTRQTTVLAYQYGTLVLDMISPTNGILLAMLALCRVRVARWLRFVVPVCVLFFVLTAAIVVVAVAVGLR